VDICTENSYNAYPWRDEYRLKKQQHFMTTSQRTNHQLVSRNLHPSATHRKQGEAGEVTIQLASLPCSGIASFRKIS
jgi:hypothetical protein